MGLFDSLQDIVGGLTENSAIQDLKDQATGVTDGATDAVNSVTEQGQSAIEDITKNLGL